MLLIIKATTRLQHRLAGLTREQRRARAERYGRMALYYIRRLHGSEHADTLLAKWRYCCLMGQCAYDLAMTADNAD